jgi:hypothetical protein
LTETEIRLALALGLTLAMTVLALAVLALAMAVTALTVFSLAVMATVVTVLAVRALLLPVHLLLLTSPSAWSGANAHQVIFGDLCWCVCVSHDMATRLITTKITREEEVRKRVREKERG